MIRINLLPSKDTERALSARNQRSLVILGAVLLIFVMLVPFIFQQQRMRRLDRQIQSTKLQVERLSEQVREVENLDKLQADLKSKLSVIEDLEERRVGPASVLSELGKATPDSLWVVDFREIGGRVTITGVSLDNETIADFMRKLRVSPYFVDVDLTESTLVTDKQAPNFKRFVVTARVDYSGKGGKGFAPIEPLDDKVKRRGKGGKA